MPGEPEYSEAAGLAQFNRHVSEARALPSKEVITFRIDPVIALQNVNEAVKNVLAAGETRLSAELPAFDVAVCARVQELAVATVFAASRAQSVVTPGTRGLLAEAGTEREKLLKVAEGLAAAGLLPAAKVRKIREGKGALDWAKDCLDLAALFVEHAAAIRGKSPVSAADVKRAGELGTQLLEVVKPEGTKKDPRSKEAKDAAADRDALGTLLLRAWSRVRCAAGWLYGVEAESYAPALGSRRPAKKRPPKPKQPPVVVA